MNWQRYLKISPRTILNRLLLGAGLLLFVNASATSPNTQVSRFQHYLTLKENLPDKINDEFLFFISDDKPLSLKLRIAWLYKLAEQKDWQQFMKFYQSDIKSNTLACYYAFAQLQNGQTQPGFVTAKPLWLVGTSQVKACDPVFKQLLDKNLIGNQLIEQRIKLALEKRNINLARYLLKKLKPPRIEDAKLLRKIYRTPQKIKHLKKDSLHGAFYLYGLKRLVSRHMDTAIRLWRQGKSRRLLTVSQQQAFLAHVALYKAMRNHKDTDLWFKMVKPDYYTDVLLHWQIRYSLKQKNWSNVLRLINHVKAPQSPKWLYWKARALQGRGKKKEAIDIFEKLAGNRHYYGFLASIQLNKPFKFESEKPLKNLAILKPYKAILKEIERLYQSKQFYSASSMINDFASELSDDEHEALAIWAAQRLKWYGKSVYLTNINEDLSDQLTLRFPLAYQGEIKRKAAKYHISPAFIYAIIRQESAFRHRVTSSAGARGLMQIMPRTASMVAQKEHIPYKNRNELFHSSKNIHLGVAYLKQLNKRFSGHPTLIAAAYNAGPNQVNYWLKNHVVDDMDIWIETLPFHETRNYLKNIIAFYAVYQYRMKQKPKLDTFLKPISFE